MRHFGDRLGQRAPYAASCPLVPLPPSGLSYGYAREGVGEFWVVNPEVRNVSRWQGRGDPGGVLSEMVQWNPAGATRPFVVVLKEFFAEAAN